MKKVLSVLAYKTGIYRGIMTDSIVILGVFFQAVNQYVQRLVFLQFNIGGLEVILVRFTSILNKKFSRSWRQHTQGYGISGRPAQ